MRSTASPAIYHAWRGDPVPESATATARPRYERHPRPVPQRHPRRDLQHGRRPRPRPLHRSPRPADPAAPVRRRTRRHRQEPARPPRQRRPILTLLDREICRTARPPVPKATSDMTPETSSQPPLPPGWRTCVLDDLKADIANAIVGGPFGSELVRSDYTERRRPDHPRHQPRHRRAPLLHRRLRVRLRDQGRRARPPHRRPGDVIVTQRGTLGQVGLVPAGTQWSRFILSQSQMKLTLDPHQGRPRIHLLLAAHPRVPRLHRAPRDHHRRPPHQPGDPPPNPRPPAAPGPATLDRPHPRHPRRPHRDLRGHERRPRPPRLPGLPRLVPRLHPDLRPPRRPPSTRAPPPPRPPCSPTTSRPARSAASPAAGSRPPSPTSPALITAPPSTRTTSARAPTSAANPSLKSARSSAASATRPSTPAPPRKSRPIDSGDLLMSWSGNPQTSIGTFLWHGGPAWLNQHIFKVDPPAAHWKSFMYCLLRELQPQVRRVRPQQTNHRPRPRHPGRPPHPVRRQTPRPPGPGLRPPRRPHLRQDHRQRRDAPRPRPRPRTPAGDADPRDSASARGALKPLQLAHRRGRSTRAVGAPT
jgi:hypothetical protein